MRTVDKKQDVLDGEAIYYSGRLLENQLKSELGKQENEIAKLLNIKQPTVNRHSNSAGWPAIESAVKYFEKLDFES